MLRIPSPYKEPCNDCQARMHSVCGGCGRAFCKTHLVMGRKTCVHCAERCSVGRCQQLAANKCHRCNSPSCQFHKPGKQKRCAGCEEDYKTALAKLMDNFEWSDSRSRSDAFFAFGGIVVGSAVIGGWAIALVALIFTVAIYVIGQRYASAEHTRKLVRSKTRKKFLAERNHGS
ncbi:MAG: hypothetical protein JKY56_25175 [Kofleriaceae bacterium]|nr:hypothetical protein [Kofleriaceae bacterium]